MLHELARIIFPSIDYQKNTNLFVNIEKKSLTINSTLKFINAFMFNTWMNIFPAKKYFYYTDVKDLYLNIQLDIDANVSVYGFNYNEAFKNNDEKIVTKEISANTFYSIKIENPQNYENLYFVIYTDQENFKITNAYWGTSTTPNQNNKLAIITCSYKREEYVKKNVAIFADFINNNPKLKEKVTFFIVDNGRTLDSSLQSDNIKLFPNKNLGGAGGFTRGIIEAIKSQDDYTRVLLMDDDIEVFPESFLKTLILSDYLKEEFKKSFIHGAMLNLYNKNIFTESSAIQTKDWVYSYHGDLDISLPENVGKSNYTPPELFGDINQKVSSAWWFCCFPISLVKEKGLPLPVFFRGDDIEWSWRNYGEHHITMNGICVWHTPFQWRVSKVVDYYFSKRNIFMLNILYTKNYKKTLLKILKSNFRKLLDTYDYSSALIYLRMMSDLLKGDETFKSDPEKLLKDISSYAKNDKVFIETNKRVLTHLNWILEKFSPNSKMYAKKYLFKNFVYLVTIKGKLLPLCFWQKQKNVCSEFITHVDFMLTKNVNVYNLMTNKYEMREFSRKTENKLAKEFNQLYKQIDKNYNKLEETFKKMSQELTTFEFWDKYLEM